MVPVLVASEAVGVYRTVVSLTGSGTSSRRAQNAADGNFDGAIKEGEGIPSQPGRRRPSNGRYEYQPASPKAPYSRSFVVAWRDCVWQGAIVFLHITSMP